MTVNLIKLLLIHNKFTQLYISWILVLHVRFFVECFISVYIPHIKSVVFIYYSGLYQILWISGRYRIVLQYSCKASRRLYSLLGYTQAIDLCRICEVCLADSHCVIALRKSLKQEHANPP